MPFLVLPTFHILWIEVIMELRRGKVGCINGDASALRAHFLYVFIKKEEKK